MLGIFTKRSGHPLMDSREVKRITAEIAARDPQGAVEEAAAWLESMATAEGFTLATGIERVVQIDEAAAPQARRLGREFIQLGRTKPAQEARLWTLAHDYWQQLVIAYAAVRERVAASEKPNEVAVPQRIMMFARELHARAALLKWDQFHYGPIASEFWSELGALYLQADADVTEGLARMPVVLYPGYPPTSIEAEYLKALLFHASAMDKLLPIEIELAERLIVHFLPRFSLTHEVRPENVYWVDATKPLPPTRLAKLPEMTPSLRFFNGGEALQEIEALQARIAAEHQVPAEVNLGGQYETAVVMAVLEHLALCWAPKPPMRKDARHRVKSRLIVAHGMEAVHGYMSGQLSDQEGIEMWLVDDVSLGGMGVQVPISRHDWVRIGVLVAMQPEGGNNWLLGVVRRFARSSATQGQVGVETLSKTPVPVLADAGGLQTATIVLDPPEVGEYARMVLAPAALEDKVALTFEMNGKRARLHPRETLETGADFVIANFFVQSYS